MSVKSTVKALILLCMMIASSFSFTDSLHIYIADWYNHRIVRIDDMSGSGWIEFGSFGDSIGSFDGPCSVIESSDGKIYVTDRGNDRVIRIDDMTGVGWIELGGFTWPRSIEQDISGRFYIADEFGHKIVRIDDITGAGWIEFGTMGSGVGQFHNPEHIKPNAGKMYISDTFNDRIVRCDDMSVTGWITYGSSGSGLGQFDRAQGIEFDAENRIYIADYNNNRIVRIDNLSGAGWMEYGTYGDGIGQFCRPTDLEVDNDGRIYIVDGGNCRIVRISDMTGIGWTEHGLSGSGVGEFDSPTHIHLAIRTGEIITDSVSQKPLNFNLFVYPNPFNSAVTISFDYGSESAKRLSTIEIFDVSGRIVDGMTVGEGPRAFMLDGIAQNGSAQGRSPTQVVWTPSENIGSGVYLVRARFGGESAAKRVVYLK